VRDIFIVSCCRTPIGRFGGSLKDTSAVKLGEIVARAAIKRAGIDPAILNEVVFGCTLTTGLGQNVSRQIAIGAGVPIEIPAFTVGMVCGGGMKSVIGAARAIMSGDAEVLLVGGTENMSASPYAASTERFGARMGNAVLMDTMINDGLTDAIHKIHMGDTAENICDQWGITREELDAYSLRSQEKAAAAIASGRFIDEIIPVPVKIKKELVDFSIDEFPRETSMEALAQVRPAFKMDGGRVTAGNSSGINDGAAAIILASADAVKKYGLKPMAKIVSWGQCGVDPTIMGIGPVPSTKIALKKVGLTVDDMDLIESNEAFAAQAIAVARELKFDMEKVNVNGGAIALGHPIGCTGSRIVVTLVHEMIKRGSKRGLATLCIGGGMGVATIFERV